MVRFSMMAICLVFVAVSATGCIISSDDSGPTDGKVSYTWSLNSGTIGPTDCATAGVVKVSMLATRASDSTGFDDKFDCAALGGTSGSLGLDQTFTVSPAALDSNGTNLSASVTFPVDTLRPCDITSGNTCINAAPMVAFALP